VTLFFCNERDLENRWGFLAGLGSGFYSAWLIMLMRRARTASPEAVTHPVGQPAGRCGGQPLDVPGT